MDVPAFRPDVFFDGAWRGWGVSRDMFGKVRDRYTITGLGEVSDARRLFRLREDYQFTDGRTDHLDWEIGSDEEGAFYGREKTGGAEGFGRQSGQDYIWSFARPVPTAIGEMLLSIRSVYTLVTADRVVCAATLKRWGLPLATLHSCYQRTPSSSDVSAS